MIGLTNAVGISHVAKSGYLSGLNNLKVFPMHNIQFADCFDSQRVKFLSSFNIIKRKVSWKMTFIINSYLDEGTLKAHWVDTCKHCLIAKCSMIFFYKCSF